MVRMVEVDKKKISTLKSFPHLITMTAKQTIESGKVSRCNRKQKQPMTDANK